MAPGTVHPKEKEELVITSYSIHYTKLYEVDVFIDGIEFFEIDIRRLLFQRARALGIYALTSAPLGFGATLQVFSPTGMSFDEYFAIKDEMEEIEKLVAFTAGLAPRPYHLSYLDKSRVNIKERKVV